MASRQDPVVCLRAEPALAEAIERMAAELGVSRSEVLRRALALFLAIANEGGENGLAD